jgi:hypothetical protein
MLGVIVGTTLSATLIGTVVAICAQNVIQVRWDAASVLAILFALFMRCLEGELLTRAFGAVVGYTPITAARLLLVGPQLSLRGWLYDMLATSRIRVAIASCVMGSANVYSQAPTRRRYLARWWRSTLNAFLGVVAYGVSRLVTTSSVRLHGYDERSVAAGMIDFALTYLIVLWVFTLGYRVEQRYLGTVHRAVPTVIAVGANNQAIGSTTHIPSGRHTCCVCDSERETTFRCVNIADHVCLGCVVHWAVQNAERPGRRNPWPCCRER